MVRPMSSIWLGSLQAKNWAGILAGKVAGKKVWPGRLQARNLLAGNLAGGKFVAGKLAGEKFWPESFPARIAGRASLC